MMHTVPFALAIAMVGVGIVEDHLGHRYSPIIAGMIAGLMLAAGIYANVGA